MKLTIEQRFRLFQIASASGGVLRVDDVINDAMSPRSPLHSLYEWDTEKAALEHWRARTREIIQSVRVTVEVRQTHVNAVAYVRDPEVNSHKQGYASVVEIATAPQRRAMTIEAEFKRMFGLLDRLRGIVQVFGMPTAEVDALIEVATRACARLVQVEVGAE